MKIPRVLTIAGSDSGGGAGIQTDLRTMAYHGCFGMSAITAVTAQNTQAVVAIEPVSAPLIRQQIQAVVNDIGVDAIKIGMLPSSEIIEVVTEELEKITHIPIVLDPVMVSTSGSRLIDAKAAESLIKKLFPLSTVVTPNLIELEALTKKRTMLNGDIEEAGVMLLECGAKSALIKGGHRDDGTANDCLILSEGPLWFRQSFINTKNTHGLGCTLSTAMACFLAKGCSIPEAIQSAKAFITECLSSFKDTTLGHGNGALFPTLLTPVCGGRS